MPTPSYSAPQGQQSIAQLQDWIIKLVRDLNYQFENLDNKNITNVADFLASEYELKSKNGLVGLSSAGTDPTSIRIWAGDADKTAAIFRVLQNGHVFASDADLTGNINALTGTIGGFTITLTKLSGAGIIEGGTVRTAAPNNQRIELTNGSFNGYTADNLLSGLVFDPNKSSDIVDLHLYHRGAQLLEFFDNIDGIAIQPGSGSSYMWIGKSGKNVYGFGTWDLTSVTFAPGTLNVNVSSANYATSSGSATSVPSTGITPGTYTKATFASDGRATAGSSLLASDIPNIAESQVTGLVSDLAGKAGKTLPAWTAPTFQNSWIANTTTGYYKDDLNIVHLKGTIKSGIVTTGTVIFNLPSGYRPGQNSYFGILNSNGSGGYIVGRIDIDANGDVVVNTLNNSFASIDGISFRAEL